MDCHMALFIRQYEIMSIVQCNNCFNNFIETQGMGSSINKNSYIYDELNSSSKVQDKNILF